MKIRVSEKEILRRYLLKNYNVRKSGNLFSIYRTSSDCDALARVDTQNLEIRVYNEDMYEALLKFGDENDYKTLVKCWAGAK